MEEEGIGYSFALSHGNDAQNALADASKNEISIETVEASSAANPVGPALPAQAEAVYQHNQTNLEFLTAGGGDQASVKYTLFLPDGPPV
jgi:hypothetical protein